MKYHFQYDGNVLYKNKLVKWKGDCESDSKEHGIILLKKKFLEENKLPISSRIFLNEKRIKRLEAIL